MRKIRSIEGLRGMLAMWVLLGHTLAAAGLGAHWHGPLAALAEGSNAVAVFIIVSGFVIFFRLNAVKETYPIFLLNRALRLYPVYLLCLLAALPLQTMEITALLSAPWPHPVNPGLVEVAQASLAHLPRQLAAHLFMIHALLPDAIAPHSTYSILGPAWSLSLEWQFYVLAPAIYWLVSRGWPFSLGLLALVITLHCVVHDREGVLTHHIPMFAVGIGSFLMWKRGERPTSPFLLPVLLILIAAVTRSVPLIVWTAAFIASYQPASHGAWLISGFLESRPLMFLGRLSYSIYLVHFLTLIVAIRLLEVTGTAALGQWPFFGILLALTLSGALVCAVVLGRFVERPFMAMERGRRTIDNRSLPVTQPGSTQA